MNNKIQPLEESKINYKFMILPIEGINLLLNLTKKEETEKHKKSATFTVADIAVLFYILKQLQYDNTAEIPQQKIISNDLNISQKQVSISINKLITQEIIIKNPKPRTYNINPKYFYIGTDKKNKIIQWKKLIKEIQK